MKMNDLQFMRIFEWFTIQKVLVIAVLFLSSHVVVGQERTYTIRGTVKDNVTPLPGASIIVEGTTTGTITDQNGNYELTLTTDQNSVRIAISSIGYGQQVQQVSLAGQETITVDVTLVEDVTELDEVLVVGSTLRSNRRELGNSISSVNTKALENSGSNNLFGALQGKIPGAQITQNSGDPAGGITIRLRGVKSLQGNSDPLYVIDGVIASNATANVSQTALSNQVGGVAALGTNRLVDLNPADIESINIINGAAAAAQYGSRASNGVVIITTKRGKEGAPRITFSTSLNINELRKKVPITTYGKQFGSAGLRLHPIGTISAAQFNSIGTGNPGAYIPAEGETFMPITRDGALAYLRTNLVDVTRYDYQDEIFRTGYGTDNNISVSGGTDKTKYFTSVSYSKNEGIIKGTDFTRYNFRARLDQRLTDWATLSAGLSYSNSFSNEKANGNVFYSPINSINITNNIYDITQRDAAGNLLAVEPTRVNPLSTIEDMEFTQLVNRTVNDLQINLTPVKGLGIDWLIGVDAYTQTGKSLIEAYPYRASAGLPLERYPNGYAASASNTVLLFNNDVNVSYELQLSDDFKINAIVGTNYQYQRADFQRSSGELLAPNIETVSGASTAIATGYGLDQFDLSGYFGQVTFGYKNLAFITGAVRRDRSSKFSASEANQTYPKFSASFVPSDLDFWEETFGNTLTSLKLRASWGQAGNLTGIGSYDRFWQFLPIAYLGRPTIVPSATLANPNVAPERMTEFEYGLDLTLFNDKINLGATFYKQSIEDLVVNRVLAASEGGTSIVNNVGEMENKGMELSLNLVPIRTTNMSWDITFLYNRNRNKITELGSPTVAIANVTGAPSFLIEGMPASVFYGTAIARDNGQTLLTPEGLLQSEKGLQNSATPLQYEVQRDANGQPTGSNIRAVIGDPNPDFTGSIMSNLSIKNFNFTILFDFVRGVDVFNADKRTRQGVGIGDFAEKEMTGELPRGYIYALYNTEEWRVDDGAFTKLREISLSYNFRNTLKGVSNINLALSGRNLVSWDNYNGYDPETNAGGNSDILRGVDFGNVPIPRTYKLQLTVTF